MTKSRGQPVVALVFILLCWVGLRAASWDHPLLAPASHAPRPASGEDEVVTPTIVQSSASAPSVAAAPVTVARVQLHSPDQAIIGRGENLIRKPRGRVGYSDFGRAASVPPVLSSAVAVSERAPAMTRALLAEDRETPSRWSGDAWLLLRRGGNVSLASGPGFATYGASQAGAVLRYRLAPQSDHRPTAYLRATAALNGSGEREVAIGVSARPISPLPVAALAELRATRQSGGTKLRPAVMAVTELPPVELPHQLRGEAYGQAGYVGGRYATAFVDGQLRLDRGIAITGPIEARLGAGAWGGAQKGASRLDLGPTAAMSVAVGQSGSIRVAADWRFRIAGNAAPASGPALTLSAGF